ncbi:Sporulation initiation inhibitor protein Soj [subsurface metagenome]
MDKTPSKGKIIAISNLKGGTGKTTSTISISSALASVFKRRTLIVDLDPQHNLTIGFGLENQDKTIFHALIHDEDVKPVQIYNRLDLIPADLELLTADMLLMPVIRREQKLTKVLEKFRNDYDYIIIDCSPSLGVLTINALIAAQYIITPVSTGTFSLKGFAILNNLINDIEREISGVFLNQYDERKLIDRGVYEALQANFKDKLFKTKIRTNTVLDQSAAAQTDIFHYKPGIRSNAAQDFKSLTKEIIKRTI